MNWAQRSGEDANDEGACIVVDDQGNTYVYGSYAETEILDNGGVEFVYTLEAGAYLSKLDPTGEIIWVKKLADAYYPWHMQGLALDAAGNPLILGYFHETIDADPGPGTHEITAQGFHDVYLEKFNTDGDFIWVKTWSANTFIQSEGALEAAAMAVDAADNVYLTGYLTSTIDLDPGSGVAELQALNDGNAWLLKLAAAGDYQWSSLLHCSAFSAGRDLTIAADGSVYLCGAFNDTLYYDEMGIPGFSATDGLQNAFFAKYNQMGETQWVRTIKGTNEIYTADIKTDADNNCYLTGYFLGTADFDPGPGNHTVASLSYFDAYLAKFDANGNFGWFRRFGGVSEEAMASGDAIGITSQNTVYLGGTFRGQGTMTGINSSVALGVNGDQNDLFLIHLDAAGEIIQGRSMGSSQEDAWNDLVIRNDNLYATGYFHSLMDFDPGSGTEFLLAQGMRDAFVMRLDNCTPTYGTDVINTTAPYTWIDGMTYMEDNFYATHTLTNSNGCDSIVKLNLTILNLGLEDGLSANQLHIYPNPAHDVVYIESELSGTLELRDATGRLVHSGKQDPYLTSVDIRNLAPGMYLLIFDHAGGRVTERVVIR